jgi:hypothetical protein
MSVLNQDPNDANSPKWLLWLKRLGVGAFLFFLIKGLLWIAIFMGLGKWIAGFF